jgi:hypothetical protein
MNHIAYVSNQVLTETSANSAPFTNSCVTTTEEKMAKIYTGKRTKETITIVVITHQPGAKTRKRKLRHIPFHSATKGDLNWGYCGSGPADSALALLVDHSKERAPSEGYRARAECNTWMVKSKAWKYHQSFKWHFVAKFGDEWELQVVFPIC